MLHTNLMTVDGPSVSYSKVLCTVPGTGTMYQVARVMKINGNGFSLFSNFSEWNHPVNRVSKYKLYSVRNI